MPEKNNLNCRIWVSNPKEKEAVLGLDPGIKMLGRSNRDVKKKKKKGVFSRPVYNSSFSPPYRGIYTILFGTRCYNGFFARPARKIYYSAPRDIIHVDYYTAAVLHYTYMY